MIHTNIIHVIIWINLWDPNEGLSLIHPLFVTKELKELCYWKKRMLKG